MKIKEKWTALTGRVIRAIQENRLAMAVFAILLAERLYVMLTLGVDFHLASDDYTYVLSGVDFANTGRIALKGILSAQVMPGLPVLTGIVSLIFGEGLVMWAALKVLWSLMGLGSALFTYKTITMYAPKWCGAVTVLIFYAMPQVVLLDNVILTETPFMFMLNVMIYSTLMLGRTKENRYFVMMLVSYFIAYMMKATIIAYPLFAFGYLLLQRFDRKRLLRQAAIIALVLVCFTVPWTIRNYAIFDRFIPVTYGAGDALMLGTYQGVNYPLDSDLDYDTYVYEPMREVFADYYDENGEITRPELAKYVEMQLASEVAKYRMSEWWERDTVNMVISYLCYKPIYMLITPFYWVEIMNVPVSVIVLFRSLILVAAAVVTLLSLAMRRYRMPIVSLAVLFIAFVYMHAMSFAYGRYAETLMPMLYIICGIGLHFITDWIKEKRAKAKAAKTDSRAIKQ